MGQVVQGLAASQQGAGRPHFQGQAAAFGEVQAAQFGPAFGHGAGGIAAAPDVGHRQPHGGGHLAEGQAGAAQGSAQGLAGQQRAVEGGGQVVAEVVGEAPDHADGRRQAGGYQGAGQAGLAIGGAAGAEQGQADVVPLGQGGQVGAVQEFGPAVVVFQEELGQGAVGGLDHAAVAGEVQPGRLAGGQGAAQGGGGGQNAPAANLAAALLQGAADAAHFVVQAQARLVVTAAPLAIDQGVGPQGDELQGAIWPGFGGRPIDQAQQAVDAGQEAAVG